MLKRIYLFLLMFFCWGVMCSPSFADYASLSPHGKATVANFQKMYGLSSPEEAYGLLNSIQSAGISMYNNWDPDWQLKGAVGGTTYSDRKKAAGANMFGGEMVGGKYLDQLLNDGDMNSIRMCIEETDSLLNTMEDCAKDGDDGAKEAMEAAEATGVWGQMRSIAGAMWRNEDLVKDKDGNIVYEDIYDENGNKIGRVPLRNSSVIKEFAQQFDLGSALVGNDKIFVRQLVQYAQDGGCWFCPIFYKGGNDGIYGAVNHLATHIYDKLNEDFLGLMGVGLLFLILFKVGKMLVQLQEVDVMQFLNDLFKPLGRAMLASAFLIYGTWAGGDTVFALITNPVLDISLRLGEEIMTTTLDNVQVIKSEIGVVDNMMQSKVKPDWAPVDRTASTEILGGTNTAMGEAPGQMIYLWMQSVASSFPVGIALGATFIEVGLDNFFSNGGFSMFLSGLILWLGFWIIYLTFPFKLIDTFVRLAFVFALMPLWIVLWVFPATQGYTKKAWEMFLSCALFFVVMSVMISLVLMLINNIVPSDIHDELFKNLREGYNDKAAELASFGSGICMNAIAFTAMAFSIISSASPLANSFVGGGGGIQTNVGAGAAVSMAKGATAAVAVGKGGAKLGRAMGAGAVSLGQKIFGKKGAAAGAAASALGHFTPSGNAGAAGGAAGGDNGGGGNNGSGNTSGGTEQGGTNPTNPTNPPETGNNTNPAQPTGGSTSGNNGGASANPASSGSSGQQTPADSATGASGNAAGTNTAANLTPEQKEALERLSRKDDAPDAFTKLGQDMQRVGALMSAKNPDEFRQQLANQHQHWDTDAKKMEEFATRMYQDRNLSTMAEGNVRAMLNDYAKSVAGSDPSGSLRTLMEPMATSSSNASDRFESLSSQLSKLASDIAGMKGQKNS